jgi:hypothetical protein
LALWYKQVWLHNWDCQYRYQGLNRSCAWSKSTTALMNLIWTIIESKQDFLKLNTLHGITFTIAQLVVPEFKVAATIECQRKRRVEFKST